MDLVHVGAASAVQMVVILGACRLSGWLVGRFLHQPRVIGDMIAGILLGPSLLGWLAPQAQALLFPIETRPLLQFVAQAGIGLYMFLVGLGFRRAHFHLQAGSAVAVSLCGIIAPFLVAVALTPWLSAMGLFGPTVTPFEATLFIGVAISITAFPVLARIIRERGLGGTPLAALALSAGAIDDAIAWSILAILLACIGADGMIAVRALGGGGLFAIVMLFLGSRLLAPLARWAEREGRVTPAMLLVVLLLFLAMRRVQRWWEARQARRRAATDSPSARAMERVQAFHQSHADWGLRVYETPKGLRVIVTHTDFAPDDPAVAQLFDALQVDPLYALLCERQQCFRARVSGKPWRMGLTGLSTSLRRWPQPEQTRQERRQWALAYDEKAQGFAACRLLQQLGNPRLCAAADAFVQWHDEASRARTDLPLA